MSDLHERLKVARESKGYSITEMADFLGMSFPGYRDNENGKRVPKSTVIKSFVDLGFDAHWLLTGEGGMLRGNASPLPKAEANESDYAYVTLYDAECSAGAGSWNEECQPLTELAFTKYSLRKQGLDANTLSAIRVAGDSMEGDLSDGDAVLVDHAQTEVKGEGIYVIRLDGHLYAKRLQRTLDGVEIISTNKAYSKMHVPKERLAELDVIGQVVWAASWIV
jgi:phage repressor protein C with HTH and peptisase S24 domain